MDTTAGISWAGRTRQTVGEREGESYFIRNIELKTNQQTNQQTKEQSLRPSCFSFLIIFGLIIIQNMDMDSLLLLDLQQSVNMSTVV